MIRKYATKLGLIRCLGAISRYSVGVAGVSVLAAYGSCVADMMIGGHSREVATVGFGAVGLCNLSIVIAGAATLWRSEVARQIANRHASGRKAPRRSACRPQESAASGPVLS